MSKNRYLSSYIRDNTRFVRKNYLPMQTIIPIDNQLVTASVVQIWFRKKGVYLVTNRTEN